MDAVTAFLYGNAYVTVYLKQTKEFEEPGYQDWVRVPKRVLYALKQAPYALYQTIEAALRGFKFVKCKVDHGIFVAARNGRTIHLAVYVDDMLIMGGTTKDTEEIRIFLRSSIR
jgi:Reverse transcriptase (RNA-dependent DNA polymerase)